MLSILLMSLLLDSAPPAPPPVSVIIEKMITQFDIDDKTKRENLIYYRNHIEEDKDGRDVVMSTDTESVRVDGSNEQLAERNNQIFDPPQPYSGNSYDIKADLFEHFDYDPIIKETAQINGHECYVISFKPKNPAPDAFSIPAIIANHLAGQLYIDTKSFRVRMLKAKNVDSFRVWALGKVTQLEITVVQDDRLGFFVPVYAEVFDRYDIVRVIMSTKHINEHHTATYTKFEKK